MTITFNWIMLAVGITILIMLIHCYRHPEQNGKGRNRR